MMYTKEESSGQRATNGSKISAICKSLEAELTAGVPSSASIPSAVVRQWIWIAEGTGKDKRNCGLRCVAWIAGGTVNIGRKCGVRWSAGERFWADRRGGERASTRNWDWRRNMSVSRPVPLE